MTTLLEQPVTMQAAAAPSRRARATVLGPGEGKSYQVVGDHVTIRLGAEHTGGRFALIETTVPPGGGPPPHVHAREAELFYVLAGELGFVANDTNLPGPAGTAVYLPTGSTHTFRNVSPAAPARFLVATAPAGFEEFMADAGHPCSARPGGEPPAVTEADLARLAAACQKHGLRLKPGHRAERVAPPGAPEKELWVLGVHVRIKLGARDTEGNFSLAELTCLPGGGVPPHLHRAEDEVFHVLEGTFEFVLGDEPGGRKRAVTVGAGSLVHVPKGVLHGFRNVDDVPAKLLNYHTPGGFEKFFEEAGIACTDINAGPPVEPADMEAMMRLIRKHGMEMPSLG